MFSVFVKIPHNILQLPEGGDFGALHYQPSRNFDRRTKLDLTNEPPLWVGAVIGCHIIQLHCQVSL